jgi:hypothetical protein
VKKEEFLETSAAVFKMLGCKQYGKKFVYEHSEMYITFMLSRSNFGDAYYLDFNCTIKSLHPGLTPSDISVKNYDFIAHPRLILAPKMVPLRLDELDVKEYEKMLQNKLEIFLKSVDKKGLILIKDYERKGEFLQKKAEELLSNY